MDIKRNLKIIEQQEKILVFDKFDNHDALILGTKIAENLNDSEKPVAVCIWLNDIPIFKYTMQGKELWHYNWAERKYRMVRATGHSSFYVMLKHELMGDFKEYENDEDKAFACGGFPIQINGKGIVGVVSISG